MMRPRVSFVLIVLLSLLTSSNGRDVLKTISSIASTSIQEPEPQNVEVERQQTGTPIRSIVVFIHGVQSSANIFASWILNASKIAPGGEWPDTTLVVKVDWGATDSFEGSTLIANRADVGIFDGWIHGMGPNTWDAVGKLKNVIGMLRHTFGFNIPIAIVSHSQGSVITLAALQEGMLIDTWILMGSSLDHDRVESGEDNVKFGEAAKKVSGNIYNYYSRLDKIGPIDYHIGRLGINGIKDYSSDNVFQDEISGVTHSGDNGWWKGFWILDTLSSGQQNGLSSLLFPGNVATLYFDRSKIDFFQGIIQPYALNGNPKWWGDANYDFADEVFYLTPGMVNGFFFDDKDEAYYKVECFEGAAQVQVLEAQSTSFNDGTEWILVQEDSVLENSYIVNSDFFDGTVWLKVLGDSPGVARCYVAFEAWDN